jgi:hypothetical protein
MEEEKKIKNNLTFAKVQVQTMLDRELKEKNKVVASLGKVNQELKEAKADT